MSDNLDENVEIVDQIVSSDLQGADDISRLEILFKNDVLYKMLERADLANKIITPEMNEKLKFGLNYRPQDAAAITYANEGTLRGWLNGRDSFELPMYINASREGKFHILDAEAVYRVRLVYMVQKELKLSLNHIANICAGKSNNSKVMPFNQNDEIMNSINEIREKNIYLENQNRMLLEMFSTLFEKDESGIKLKKQSPLLLENAKFYEEVQSNISKLEKNISDLKDELQSEREKNKINVKLEISKVNMMYKKAEYLALQKRSLIEKILNKKPTPEDIEKYLEGLKNKEE
ncbi:hypothetical protein [Acetivibrio cellulolyticus]|uniref:hypothetical protein n=1 Tax=Acetivibrio cellulolyticus TaxID=35830 RepID=UPI0001E2C797|nr:hypothetical protein [Acetivibrio cellulolyticus]